MLAYFQDGESLDYTPGGNLDAGTPVRLPDGRIGVVPRPSSSGELAAVQTSGIFRGDAASADTWSAGDSLVYVVASKTLAKAALTQDATLVVPIGPAAVAKTDGQTSALVHLAQGPRNSGLVTQSVVHEFDCQTGEDAAAHVLIPAEHNPHGLLLLATLAVVTEVFGGDGEDQGVVSVRYDTTAVSTITATNGAADATGDILVGTLSIIAASSGAVAPIIPAGKAVNAIVSQATSGTGAAGKMKVYIVAVPLL